MEEENLMAKASFPLLVVGGITPTCLKFILARQNNVMESSIFSSVLQEYKRCGKRGMGSKAYVCVQNIINISVRNTSLHIFCGTLLKGGGRGVQWEGLEKREHSVVLWKWWKQIMDDPKPTSFNIINY